MQIAMLLLGLLVMDSGTTNVVKPVTGRVVRFEVLSNDLVVTVAAGSDQGVDKTWKGTFLTSLTDDHPSSSDFVIVRIDKRTTVGRTHLTRDEVMKSGRVRFAAP